MKVHPRNEGTSTTDLIMLIGMPVSMVILIAAITYFAVASLHMTTHG